MTGKGKDVGPDRLNDQVAARLVKKTALAAGVRAGVASSAEVDERHMQKRLGHASAEMPVATSAGVTTSASISQSQLDYSRNRK